MPLYESRLTGNIEFHRSGLSPTLRMTTTRTYDKLNRLRTIASTAVSNTLRPLRYEYNYNDANQRIQVMHADGSYWVYNYDRLGQISSAKKFWNDGTPVSGQQFEYGHDDIGNRTETRMGGDSQGQGLRAATYSSNERNQYTSRTVPGAVDVLGVAHGQSTVTVNGTAAYRKGEYFHRTVPVDNVTPAAGAYPSLTTQASRAGFTTETTTGNVFLPKTPEGFTHDADGNLTFDGRWIYTWNGENRLIRMESYSGAPAGSYRKVEMTYDWQGRRIERRVWTSPTGSAIATRYVYDGWNLIAELNGANAVQRTFIWGTDLSGTMQGAGGVGGLLMVRQVVTPAMTHYVAYDGNGNVTGLVNASTGDYSALYEYDPFGQTIRITGTMAKNNPFRFSTKYTDDATDMVYYGYRYYNPSTGRWLSRDPIEERGGPNLYGFVYNNPAAYVDGLGDQAALPPGWAGPNRPYNPTANPFTGPGPEWNELADALSIALIALDLALAGPTGEGLIPAAAIQCFKRCPSPQAIKSAVEKIKNITKSLKGGSKGDISAVTKEMTGGRIPDPRTPGRNYDHIKEWEEKMRGLRKHRDTLKNCNDPASKQAVKEAERVLKELEDAIKGIGI
jgi:RHS repeat-associated protein